MKTNKKGFVLIETLVVMCVVTLSLLMLYKMYSTVSENLKNRKYYDNINDVYKVNAIEEIISSFELDKENENNIDFIRIKYDSIEDEISCNYNDNTDCSNTKDGSNIVFKELEVKNIYLNRTSITNLNDSTNVDNSAKEYIKTLDETKQYIIVNFERNGIDFYSSLEVGEV